MFVFLCQLQNCHVRDMLLPSYLENFSEALDLKGVNPLLLSWLASKSHNHTAIRTGQGFYRGELWSFHLYLWCSRCCLAYAPAIANLFQMSVVLPPLLFTLAQRYVKLSISSVSLFFAVRLATHFQHIEFLVIHFHPHFCCHPALLWVHCWWQLVNVFGKVKEKQETRHAAALFDSGHHRKMSCDHVVLNHRSLKIIIQALTFFISVLEWKKWQ